MSDEGVKTGLWLWIVFLVGFFILGYAPELSIVLGAIAGLAGGFIMTFLKAKPVDKPAEEKEGFFQKTGKRLWKLGSRGEDAPVSSSSDPWKVKTRKRRKTL